MIKSLKVVAFAAAFLPFASLADGDSQGGSDQQYQTSGGALASKRLGNVLSGSPKEIINMRQRIQNSAAATRAPIQGNYDESISQDILDIEDIFDITLEHGDLAPRVFIAKFQSTAISFIDAFGKPWPIRKVSNFMEGQIVIDRAVENPTGSGVSRDEDEEEIGDKGISLNDPQAGSFSMTALVHGVVGNITVYLVGLQNPVTIIVNGKPSMFHRTATMRVASAGPQTDQATLYRDTGVKLGMKQDPDMNNALYGISPSGAETMVLDGDKGRAWLKGDYLYVQTPLAVFAPNVLDTSHGNGKYRAYKLPKTTRYTGTDENGNTVYVRVLRSQAVISERGN